MTFPNKTTLAYIVGCALGDGNLSSPNGRVTRLRITCDTRYPEVGREIFNALAMLFPKNKVSIVKRSGQQCFDISVYSKLLDSYIPWKVGMGSKILQRARVPEWIRNDQNYSKECLRGLIQTDGCIYKDRGYQMVNFVNNSSFLAQDVYEMLLNLGFRARLNILPLQHGGSKYTVKIARTEDVLRLTELLNLYKA